MKRFLLAIFSLIVIIGISLPQKAEACNRSFVRMDSLVLTPGGTYILYITMCIGTGRNGVDIGGDQNTGIFQFGFYDSDPTALTISAVTPMTVTPGLYTSTSSYQTAGAACPPGSNPFGWDCGIGYTPTTPARFFGCINNQTDCGDTAQQCFNFSFTMNKIPDSIRAYGIEGGNIATNGCYPNSDMGIDLHLMPVVWGSFVGFGDEAGVKLNWITYNDFTTTNYVVGRAADGLQFSSIGSVNGKVLTKGEVASYEFFDPNPLQGINYYKLTQMYESGALSSSEIIQVVYNAPSSTQWNFVSPVPSQDYVNLSFRSPTAQKFDLQVVDMKGNIVHTGTIDALVGSSDLTIDLSSWAAGFYFIRLSGADQSLLERKIVKL